MDDELQQLEVELKRLQPVAPSAALSRRIETQLTASAKQRVFPGIAWIGALALPAAAVIALIMANNPGIRRQAALPEARIVKGPARAGVNATDAPLKPIAAEKILVSADDEGVVTLDDGTQARRE